MDRDETFKTIEEARSQGSVGLRGVDLHDMDLFGTDLTCTSQSESEPPAGRTCAEPTWQTYPGQQPYPTWQPWMGLPTWTGQIGAWLS